MFYVEIGSLQMHLIKPRSHWSRVCPNYMTSVLQVGRFGHKHTGRMSCVCEVTSDRCLGMLKTTHSHQELGEAWDRCLPYSPQGESTLLAP
jgi:hypothetical protein